MPATLPDHIPSLATFQPIIPLCSTGTPTSVSRFPLPWHASDLVQPWEREVALLMPHHASRQHTLQQVPQRGEACRPAAGSLGWERDTIYPLRWHYNSVLKQSYRLHTRAHVKKRLPFCTAKINASSIVISIFLIK